MKTAVDKVYRGQRRDVNTRFKAMVGHVLFEAEFCNPAAGWEQGQLNIDALIKVACRLRSHDLRRSSTNNAEMQDLICFDKNMPHFT